MKTHSEKITRRRFLTLAAVGVGAIALRQPLAARASGAAMQATVTTSVELGAANRVRMPHGQN